MRENTTPKVMPMSSLRHGSTYPYRLSLYNGKKKERKNDQFKIKSELASPRAHFDQSLHIAHLTINANCRTIRAARILPESDNGKRRRNCSKAMMYDASRNKYGAKSVPKRPVRRSVIS